MVSPCTINTWLQGDTWHQCIFEPAAGSVGGEPMFGLLVGATLIVSLYLAGSGDLATPTVVTLLLGSVLVPVLPGGMVGVAYGVVVAGVSGALIAIARRYVLDPGSQSAF
jgi:hypothetical protein